MALRMLPREALQRLSENDPNLVILDLSGSSIFQMKATEYTDGIVAALKGNTNLRELHLSNCNITNINAASIAKVLESNNTLEVLNLEYNKLGNDGAIAIANSLRGNTSLKDLRLLGQSQKFGEPCLTAFVEMFETNTTLIRIAWRLESRQSFKITKCLTRNRDIERRAKAGEEPAPKPVPVKREAPVAEKKEEPVRENVANNDNHSENLVPEEKPSIRGISHGSFANRRSIFEQGEKGDEKKEEVKQERRSQSVRQARSIFERASEQEQKSGQSHRPVINERRSNVLATIAAFNSGSVAEQDKQNAQKQERVGGSVRDRAAIFGGSKGGKAEPVVQSQPEPIQPEPIQIVEVKVEEPVVPQIVIEEEPQPVVVNEQPAVNNEEQVINNEEPVVHEESVAEEVPSIVVSEEPAVNNEEPVINNEEPVVHEESVAVSDDQQEETISNEASADQEPSGESVVEEPVVSNDGDNNNEEPVSEEQVDSSSNVEAEN